ncbi:MAG: hypothetical protein D6675_14410 [Gemmatimonadetes bacterium]|nr:MAG: hypothetical protein D6675_14410 [Gemmatimonadota bacterium]
METNHFAFIERQDDLQQAVDVLKTLPLLALDTETTGLDPHLDRVILLQIGDLTHQYVIDTRKVDIEPLRPILEGTTPKILHNAKFDYQMIRGTFNIMLENVIDTMLIEKILYNGKKYEGGFSLKNVCQFRLGIEISKEAQESFIDHKGDFTPEQIEYARLDVIYPFQVALLQFPDLVKEDLVYIARLECHAACAFGDMEFNGFFLDQEKWRGLVTKSEKARDIAKEKLDAIIRNDPRTQKFVAKVVQDDLFSGAACDLPPVTLNYDSDQQLKEALNLLGIEVSDTGRDTLLEFGGGHEIINLILEYREHQKVISTYGESFLKHIHPKTQRIHPNFQQLGAESGRVSCTKPNLQNIKAGSDFRNSFIAAPGYKMITSDYSGAELRIIAHASEDPVFIETFHNGGDLHSIVASTMFGVPVSKTENKHLRQAAKAINFGLAYGMGAQGLAKRIDKPVEEAEELMQQYFKSYSKIKSFLDRSAKEGVEKGYSRTFAGRKRYFEEYKKAKTDRSLRGRIERQAKNTPIQGTNADFTKLAMVRLRDRIRRERLDMKLVNTVHDEIVLEVKAEFAEEGGRIVEEEMVNAAREFITKVPVEVDCAIEDFWTK